MGDTSTAVTWSDINERFQTWLGENDIELTMVPDEEMFKRECLVKAISENFSAIKQMETAFNKDFFKKAKLLTQEELRYADQSQRTRRLLMMVQWRDYRTILLFLWNLGSSNKALVHNVLSCYRTHLTKVFEVPKACTRCILVERVSICLIVDSLMCCSKKLKCFAEKVSEEMEPAMPSRSRKFWEKLFALTIAENKYNDVITLIMNCVEACGYHRDIVRYLKEDQRLVRNSFCCICEDKEQGQYNVSASSDENSKDGEQRQKDVKRRKHEHSQVHVRMLLQRNSYNRPESKSTNEQGIQSIKHKQDEELTESESSIEGPMSREPKSKLLLAETSTKKIDDVIKNRPGSTNIRDADMGSKNRNSREVHEDVQMERLKFGLPEYDCQEDSALPESLKSSASGDGDRGWENVSLRHISNQNCSDIELHSFQIPDQNSSKLNYFSQSHANMDIEEINNGEPREVVRSDMDTDSHSFLYLGNDD